jgi:uncharacterized membrane protein
MKEQTLQQLLEYIQQSAEFTKEQAPLVAQEIINLGYVNCTIWLIVILSVLILSIIAFFFGVKTTNSQIQDPVISISLAIGGASIIALLINLYCWLYVVYCPRLYVLTAIKQFFHQ